jgi:hypothetical protein
VELRLHDLFPIFEAGGCFFLSNDGEGSPLWFFASFVTRGVPAMRAVPGSGLGQLPGHHGHGHFGH